MTTVASALSSSSGMGWGRFAPGTLLAGRFRIVAPLGRGGIGEVYRADDRKLDQTVALKFLPEFMAMEVIPLTTDLSRPYASSSALLIIDILTVAAYGFYASRGDEPLFGRPLLD